MTKKHFIALADAIRPVYESGGMSKEEFEDAILEAICNFCESVNSNFMKERWIDYVRGICGPNGGKK